MDNLWDNSTRFWRYLKTRINLKFYLTNVKCSVNDSTFRGKSKSEIRIVGERLRNSEFEKSNRITEATISLRKTQKNSLPKKKSGVKDLNENFDIYTFWYI